VRDAKRIFARGFKKPKELRTTVSGSCDTVVVASPLPRSFSFSSASLPHHRSTLRTSRRPPLSEKFHWILNSGCAVIKASLPELMRGKWNFYRVRSRPRVCPPRRFATRARTLIRNQASVRDISWNLVEIGWLLRELSRNHHIFFPRSKTDAPCFPITWKSTSWLGWNAEGNGGYCKCSGNVAAHELRWMNTSYFHPPAFSEIMKVRSGHESILWRHVRAASRKLE